MPVELSIVESTTELGQTVVEVILESASEPGPAGPGVPAGGSDGQVLTKTSATDYATAWEDATGGGGVTDADFLVGTAHGGLSAEIVVGTSPGGELGGTWASPTVDAAHAGSSHAAVQAAAEATAAGALATHTADTTAVHGIADTAALALSANVQPLDSDLTAIAALTTTSFGRSLLELANQAALLSAAGAAAASHAHAGEDVTSGTVADARIASTIARDSEVTSAISALSSVYQPLDSDLTAVAALTTTSFGRAFLAFADEAAFKAGVNLEAGTDFPSQSTFDDHSARHEDAGADEISIAGLSGTSAALQTHLDDTADAHDASAVSVLDTGANFTATDVEGVLAEIASAGGGSGEAMERAIAQTAHGLAVGDVVRHNGTIFVKAQANSGANSEVAGIVSAVAGVNDFTLHYGGRVTGFSSLTAGTVYFLDDDTAGLLTDTEPTDNGDVSKPLLLADSTTAGYFFNFRGMVVGAGSTSGGASLGLVVAIAKGNVSF